MNRKMKWGRTLCGIAARFLLIGQSKVETRSCCVLNFMAVQVYLVDKQQVNLLEGGLEEYVKAIKRKNITSR
jgi:hypothetical protein